MDIKSTKIDLIKWLTEIQDTSILEKVRAFKEQAENLSDEQSILLNDRIEQYGKNPENVLDWDEVISDLEKDL